ncbi:shikimate dehydrogenase [Salisediminibacterium halotolerans]|uniref:Shikimate dehydrogenase (NADP(+)) n=1 Tax=Salisediminibacterium halotolerans TaxID=517425 RepID=A0A1H9S496_9BACI|nr:MULTISPECIES: shikimate dehydrogenase [Salisediminibacterium]RLJ78183.1 shikimate dehydrogenase [Actinophytocola xinjiangensis]RPE88478.1 shikimate dehydrogenase [Salisediminibacterium halotolerans]TWG37160.1 shikimate dehydrogenase [Salisediminibacterium halotolerans]SER79748.1 shikimate dehydrogenase [Salisediminibacterium haloalkalitolerans]GEL08638.1 shikimate dehydrogenase (NADP(+)) [Salisediminibacterium halotolerans]
MKKVFGVIGDPIAHSMSPVMHEAAFEAAGFDGAYHKFHVSPERLKDAMTGIRGLGLGGVNVTIPHKVTVMDYLDEIDPLAEKIGAVNTVVNENERLIGYNTDGEGFYTGLEPLLPKPVESMRVLIIGAGGAARAVAMTLAEHGAGELYITNRTEPKAAELAKACRSYVDTRSLTLTLAQARLTEFDLIINTTSVGMSPDTDRIPISLEMLGKRSVVCDLIYHPLETRFLAQSKKQGALTQNGLSMFVNQGALAFERWTNERAPREAMRQRVIQELGGS